MHLKSIITLAISVLVMFLIVEQHQKIGEAQRLKEEKSIVLNIKYGLLSLDEWKAKSYEAISHRVSTFEITGDDREAWRPQIMQLLYQLVDEVQATVRARFSNRFRRDQKRCTILY
jgi:acetyl-CoA carboxylase alpha subunit